METEAKIKTLQELVEYWLKRLIRRNADIFDLYEDLDLSWFFDGGENE